MGGYRRYNIKMESVQHADVAELVGRQHEDENVGGREAQALLRIMIFLNKPIKEYPLPQPI